MNAITIPMKRNNASTPTTKMNKIRSTTISRMRISGTPMNIDPKINKPAILPITAPAIAAGLGPLFPSESGMAPAVVVVAAAKVVVVAWFAATVAPSVLATDV